MPQKKPAADRTPRRSTASRSRADGRRDGAVNAYVRDLKSPLREEVEAVRRIILGVSAEIREGIKWNAPSFRTTDDFATFNVRGKVGQARLRLILHTGARAKGSAVSGLNISDPSGLLQWLATDRCLVAFNDVTEINAKRAALEAVIREGIAQL